MMTVAAPAFVSHDSPTVSPSLRNLLQAIREVVPDAILVGGAVRDLVASREPIDIDLVTYGDPHAAAAAIGSRLGGHPFTLDPARGHYRVTLVGDAPLREIDISRIESLEADLARRDFTVDALAAAWLEDGSLGDITDPYGGMDDVRLNSLRMVSSANLADDPLRLLRAVRLATELEMTIEPATAATIRQLAPRLSGSAGERQREELVRVLASPRAVSGIRLADELGLLEALLPELAPARGVEQPSNHHYYDVFEHSVQALAALDEMLHDIPTSTDRPWLGPDFRDVLSDFDIQTHLSEHAGGHSRLVLLKLAGLLHDVSKPETRALHEDGRIRFLGHPEKGAAKAQSICARLRFSNRESQFVSLLVEEHLRPTMLAPQGQPPSDRALYRFFRDLGDAAPACLILSLADAAAATGPRLQRDRWRRHVAYVRYVLAEAIRLHRPTEQKKPRLITGHDLISELGFESGPRLGEVLAAVDEAHALGEVTTREEALEYARGVAQGDDVAPGGTPHDE